ncbi:hypothetical protein [Bacillus gaemokensis]|uniref:hypothetical protein n=1 Tax=Bacillus gaemokensis TaxID=574375 RepID=UPI000B228958|nr:hypothetical protein [Bacillus gaemokensis]
MNLSISDELQLFSKELQRHMSPPKILIILNKCIVEAIMTRELKRLSFYTEY